MRPLVAHELGQTLGLVPAHRAREVGRLVHLGLELVEERRGLALGRRDGAARRRGAAVPARGPVDEGDGERGRGRVVLVVDERREVAQGAPAGRHVAVVVVAGRRGCGGGGLHGLWKPEHHAPLLLLLLFGDRYEFGQRAPVGLVADRAVLFAPGRFRLVAARCGSGGGGGPDSGRLRRRRGPGERLRGRRRLLRRAGLGRHRDHRLGGRRAAGRRGGRRALRLRHDLHDPAVLGRLVRHDLQKTENGRMSVTSVRGAGPVDSVRDGVARRRRAVRSDGRARNLCTGRAFTSTDHRSCLRGLGRYATRSGRRRVCRANRRGGTDVTRDGIAVIACLPTGR